MSEGRRLAVLEVLLVFVPGSCLALVGCRPFGTWRPMAVASCPPIVSGALHDGHRFQLDGCPALPPLVTPTSFSHFLQEAPIGHTPSVQDLCIPEAVNSVTPIPTVSHTSLQAGLRPPGALGHFNGRPATAIVTKQADATLQQGSGCRRGGVTRNGGQCGRCL